MKRRNSSNFIIGLIIGVLVGVIVWYWQKSTSAEDGALALLDRLAAAERKLRELSTDFSRRTDGRSFTFGQYPDSSDDLQRVRGVGPAYEHRLRRAGITTIRELVDTGEDDLARILQASRGRAANILREAEDMARS
jgi:predicted flap endonuclease-1-like 5' DNA nuclease